jgi:hypothetical protein
VLLAARQVRPFVYLPVQMVLVYTRWWKLSLHFVLAACLPPACVGFRPHALTADDVFLVKNCTCILRWVVMAKQ